MTEIGDMKQKMTNCSSRNLKQIFEKNFIIQPFHPMEIDVMGI